MKALVLSELGGPENLVIQDIKVPEPAEGEVRVRIKRAALNRRDAWITVGKYPRIQLPSVGGSDGAGIVDSVGIGVDSSIIGSEVVIYPARNWGDDPRCGGKDFRVLGMPDQGTFAEAICVPVSDIAPKPTHLSWDQAAAIPLAGLTSWRALITHGEVSRGQKVLVTGVGGGVASFALLWAKFHGAEVYVTSGSNEKLTAARAIGAVDGVNYHERDWDKAIRQMSGGIDIVIDSAGGTVMNNAMNTLNVGGRFVFFGATLGNPDEGLEMAKMFFKQARIQGTTMGMPSEFRSMLEFVEQHKIEPVLDQVFPIELGVAAHQRMWKSEQMGKIVLAIS
ncbi:MAG TPA: alcohol dehydrogenase [Gammaproteobacteria bacterium]|nr:alcohol dehydrogenase [Gammaproteobacteria bacterium]|tara:strand:+ start:2503 stop:3510 length:1008 start_codon:yes stop_codon:yes gene_type:complete